MQIQRLEQIPVRLNPERIGKRLHAGRTEDEARIQSLVEIAQALVKAKALFRVSYIERKDENSLVLDGVQFHSRVLRKNLDDVGRAFPYVLTIGPDVEARADQCEDLLEKYYLDVIGNIALEQGRRHLQQHLQSRFGLQGISYMSPGSLEDWPLEEQKPLFSLLGDVNARLGVRLTESYLMIPRKSVSGIYFPTEVTFFSCQLCPRESCTGRKAPYSETLAREYGVDHSKAE